MKLLIVVAETKGITQMPTLAAAKAEAEKSCAALSTEVMVCEIIGSYTPAQKVNWADRK